MPQDTVATVTFDLEAQELAAAAQAGTDAARAIKPGDVFQGAIPTAMAAGYAAGSPWCSMFIHGYLDVLLVRFPRGVSVDRDGRIVEA